MNQLIKSRVQAVITSLSELSSSGPDVTKEIGENITYFTNNQGRMRYNEYRRKGYHIGSGIVESACKHVVGQRLKQAGMTWSVERTDAIFSSASSGRMVNGIGSGRTEEPQHSSPISFTCTHLISSI